MTRKDRHLHQDARGRYYARMGVPAALRKIIGKRELLKALGGDRQVALRKLPEVVAGFHRQMDEARALTARGQLQVSAPTSVSALTIEEIAAQHYADRTEADERARDVHPGYARLSIDDGYISVVKEIAAGAAHNDTIARVFGGLIRGLAQRGSYFCEPGSTDWRRLARHLAYAEIEFLKRMFERDEADTVTSHPLWLTEHLPTGKAGSSDTITEVDQEETSIRALFDRCRKAKTGTEDRNSTDKAYERPIASFIEFLGADDVRLVTNRKINEWIEHLRFEENLKPKTISSRHLNAVRSTLRWAGN